MKIGRDDNMRPRMSPLHGVKSARIRSYSGPHFPAFGLNTERYCVSLCIQSECGKMRTRITPNMDTFYAALNANFIDLVTIIFTIFEITVGLT